MTNVHFLSIHCELSLMNVHDFSVKAIKCLYSYVDSEMWSQYCGAKIQMQGRTKQIQYNGGEERGLSTHQIYGMKSLINPTLSA